MHTGVYCLNLIFLQFFQTKCLVLKLKWALFVYKDELALWLNHVKKTKKQRGKKISHKNRPVNQA